MTKFETVNSVALLGQEMFLYKIEAGGYDTYLSCHLAHKDQISSEEFSKLVANLPEEDIYDVTVALTERYGFVRVFLEPVSVDLDKILV